MDNVDKADHEKQAADTRSDQCNPNHVPTGPGHNAGYEGFGDKADKDNHANQLNPNNPNYQGGNQPSSRGKK